MRRKHSVSAWVFCIVSKAKRWYADATSPSPSPSEDPLLYRSIFLRRYSIRPANALFFPLNSILARCLTPLDVASKQCFPLHFHPLCFHLTDLRLWRNLRRQQWRRNEVDIRRHRWRHIRRIIHGRRRRLYTRRPICSVVNFREMAFSDRASGVHPHQKNRETKEFEHRENRQKIIVDVGHFRITEVIEKNGQMS